MHCALLVVLAAGCAKAKAETVPDGPPLAMPAPPPRVLVPVDEPLASNPTTPDTPTSAPRAAAPTRPAPRRPAAAPANGDAESKPAEPPPPATQPPANASQEPARPAAVPVDPAAEKRIRDVLARAARDLGRVDYRRLSVDGRDQYDQSKRISEQTEQALRERNYIFAATLADKAATLAAALLGR